MFIFSKFDFFLIPCFIFHIHTYSLFFLFSFFSPNKKKEREKETEREKCICICCAVAGYIANHETGKRESKRRVVGNGGRGGGPGGE